MKLLNEGEMLLQQNQLLRVPLNNLFELQWPHPTQLWTENTPLSPLPTTNNKLSRILKEFSITGCVSADHPNALFQSILNCLLSLIYTNPKCPSSVALLSSLKSTLYSEDINLADIEQAGVKIHNLHTKALIARFFARCSHSIADTCKDLANWAVKNNPLLRTSFCVFFRAVLLNLEIQKAQRFACYLNPQECAATIFSFFDLHHREYSELYIFQNEKQFWLSGDQHFLNGCYQAEKISISLIIKGEESRPQEHLTKVKSNLYNLIKPSWKQEEIKLSGLHSSTSENDYVSMLREQLDYHLQTEQKTTLFEGNKLLKKKCPCFQIKMTKNKLSKAFQLSYIPIEQSRQVQQNQLFFYLRGQQHKVNHQSEKIQFDRRKIENNMTSSSPIHVFKKKSPNQGRTLFCSDESSSALLKPPQLISKQPYFYSSIEQLRRPDLRPKVHTMTDLSKVEMSNTLDSKESLRNSPQGMQFKFGMAHDETFGKPKILREATPRNLTFSAKP